MSDDLIIRKALLSRLEKQKNRSAILEEQFWFDGVMAIVDTQPTAFDEEKVMEELHDAADLSVEDGLWHVELREALGIVEKGGIG